jgi:hypothetical protein
VPLHAVLWVVVNYGNTESNDVIILR